jgi:hypothetical protein
MIKTALYSQRDSQWSGDKHGSSATTIGQTGCTICVLTAILVHAGYNETPRTVNRKLTENRGYADGNLLIWIAVPRIWPKLTFRGRITSYNDSLAKEWVAKGIIPLIRVNPEPIGGAPGGAHWIGALGDGKTFDPWAMPGSPDQVAPFGKWSPNGMALYDYKPTGDNEPTPTPPADGHKMDQEAYNLLVQTWKDAGITPTKSEKDKMVDLRGKIKEYAGTDWNGGYVADGRKKLNDLKKELGLSEDAEFGDMVQAIKDLQEGSTQPIPGPIPAEGRFEVTVKKLD